MAKFVFRGCTLFDLSNRVKAARKLAGFKTQAEFAKAIGVTRGTLAKYETKPGAVTLDALEAMAAETNLPLAWFFLEDGQRLVSSEALDQKKALALIRKGLEFLEASQTQEVDEEPSGDVFSEEIGPSSPDPSVPFGRGTRKQRKAEIDSSDGAGA